jgi:hypothetical protein
MTENSPHPAPPPAGEREGVGDVWIFEFGSLGFIWDLEFGVWNLAC